jgi:hypothetical protein
VIELKAESQASAEVSGIVIYRGGEDLITRLTTTCRTTAYYEAKDTPGYIYTEGAYLYHHIKCCKNVLCSTCCRESLKLSEIDEVDVIENERVKYGRISSIRLSPGLRITADPNTTVLVAMSDPAPFAASLLQASRQAKSNLKGRGRRYQGKEDRVQHEPT